MTMLLFTGDGFPLKDGTKSCEKFKVYARNLEEAAFALNTAAGWMRVNGDEKEQAKVLGTGVPVEGEMTQPEVHLKWTGQRGYEKVENLKRGRGALRLKPDEPNSTRRVRKSVEKLIKEGGHRSTVRFSSQAWYGLQAVAKVMRLNHSETLEALIKAEMQRLGEAVPEPRNSAEKRKARG